MIATTNRPQEDYLPARMLNEFVYCPRLFYYEHVEGLFVHNRETIEGELRHSRVDQKQDDLPPPEELAETDRPVRSRSVMLSSDAHGVIAKIDLVETDGNLVLPVDYKRGRPRKADDGSIEAWDTDTIQSALQALVLRESGYLPCLSTSPVATAGRRAIRSTRCCPWHTACSAKTSPSSHKPSVSTRTSASSTNRDLAELRWRWT